MDLEGAYLNPADQVTRLQTLLELPGAARARAPRRAGKQAQKRLDAEEVARLVAEHQAGAGVKELARRFGIHRETVSNILRREGALRSPGVRPDDVAEIVRLYEEGWSLSQLAERFDVAPDTVGQVLRSAGVTLRQPGGQPRTSRM